MTVKPMLGFGWLLSPNEFKELFPNYEDTPEYFRDLVYVDQVFFGAEIVSLAGGKPTNISEVIIDYLEKADGVAEEFASILRYNNIPSWDEESKWYTPQVYFLEVFND